MPEQTVTTPITDSDVELDEYDEDGCEGHESLAGARMGQTVYCDGSCQ